MTSPTHMTFALFVYLLLLTTAGVALSEINAAVMVVASIVPDIDTGASAVGRILPFLSGPLERRFGHRTLTHSALCVTLLALAALPLRLASQDAYVCLILGYATHPFLDTMNVNGVRLFYPFSAVKCVFPLEVNNPARYRTRTGSALDRALGLIFLAASLPVFLIASQGYERFIRSTQKNIESAVRDYNSYAATHLVTAELEAHNLLTRESIAGRFEIVGALNDHTLLFKGGEGELHSLGREYQAEFAAERVVCYRGEAARTRVRVIDMSNQPLSSLQAYLDPRWENQLFGSLGTRDQVSLPQHARPFESVSSFNGVLSFQYATLEEIHLYRLENVFVDKGVLTVRTVMPVAAESLSAMSAELDSTTSGYAAHTLAFGAGEWIRQAVRVGDTVRPGQLLASVDDGGISVLREEADRDRKEVRAGEQQSQLDNLDRRIIGAQENLRRDSLACAQASRLQQEGFASSTVPLTALARFSASRRTLEGLLRRRAQLLERWLARHEIGTLDSLLRHRRGERARARNEICAGCTGIVVDIRRAERAGRSHLTILVRVL